MARSATSRTAVLLATLAAVAALAGCGGRGSPSGSTTAGQASSPGQTPAGVSTGRGDTSIQDFGQGATGADRSSAEAALHGYLAARAAGDYTRACSFLSSGFQQQLAYLVGQASQGRSPICPAALAAMSASLPAQIRRQLAMAQITAVRVSGDRAFVLYRGAHGLKSFIPLSRQGASWKVAAIAGSNL